MQENAKSRGSFTGSLGFVLAAAGSAVGLGNIWRFPYLAAKDGGGLFLCVYILLAVTFGFTLLTTEIAIGRKTKQSPLTAYNSMHKGFKWLGVMGSIVPFMILPYYCVIGGWVLKYFMAFAMGQGEQAATGEYFTSFITNKFEPVIMMYIFLVVCAIVIFCGVNGGIEKLSKLLMPVLLILILGIAIFSLTLDNTEGDTTRTGMQGMKIYLIPDFESITLKKLFTTITDAMGQLFYSLSVAMGIMITYGSYVKDKENLSHSINEIEVFDTIVAFLAGVMIIPAVYVFLGNEGLEQSGPSLIFVALPKVFVSMGTLGNVVGALFFAMVLVAAITSAVSIFEAVVSSLMDKFNFTRRKSTLIEGIAALIIAVVVCLGYNVLNFSITLPNGSKNSTILDILDYVSNQVLMPVVAIGTCILVGWIIKPDKIIAEVTKNGEKFGRKKLYIVMVRYVTPCLLAVLLMMSLGVF